MLVDDDANYQIEFTSVKFWFLLYQLFCSSVNNNKLMIFHNFHVNSFASSLLVLCLFITHPCFFLIFHQVVEKPFRFISHVLQTNESFLNESTFPSSLSLSLSVFILGYRQGKCPSNFCINISINVFININVFNSF